MMLSGPIGAENQPTPAADPDVRTAYQEKRSKIWVTAEGRVNQLLEDDHQGRRHQRFIVVTHDGLTVLIAHDLQAAPRAILQVGSDVRVRGEYLWNLQGGIIHKTHQSPERSGGSGWIEVLSTGKRYE